MHRAEKSSSKICRTREVERAQELHRKKIDGVKSYMLSTVAKPTGSRTSTSLHLRPARSMTGSFAALDVVPGDPQTNTDTSSTNTVSSGDLEHQIDCKSGNSKGNSEVLILDDGATQQKQPMDEFQLSLAKMEEFRGVAPVPGLGSVAPAKHRLAPPPAGSRKKSMNGSLRTRRLKEIKADNVDVFERIRKSVSHYRNDDLRREWHQNLSYLSSISEFPLSTEALALSVGTHKQHTVDNDDRNCFGPPRGRSSFLKTSTRAEPLPSISTVAHPIKSIPTSPKKLQLNMSPAFRSLRKAMPQQPALPPISAPHSILSAGGATDSSPNVSSSALPSPEGRSTCPNGPGADDYFTESTSRRNLPFRSSTAIAGTKFIGDLHGRQAESDVSGDAKYQLLKTGRFVGGIYLVLTVFCGDGVTNPYGFDVFAYHRELECEYKLSITKEMTHELLDKSSSSSLAAETAAAAGTNLSMQEIARNICDHINFAVLGVDQGEMMFLAPSVARQSDQTAIFDASSGPVAFCLHQSVEMDEVENDDPQSSRYRLANKKKTAHVFASTCVAPKGDPSMGTPGHTICFEIMDKLPSPRSTSSSEPVLPGASSLKVEASVDELFNNILFGSWRCQERILSIERMAIAAIQHLHIISVPSNDDIGTLRNELIVNSHINTMIHPCSSRATTTLEKKRLRQQPPHSTSHLFTPMIRTTILIQSGLIWRNVYLLAEIALDYAEDETESSRQIRLIQDVECDLVVSVFNPNSGCSACRRLSPEKTISIFERLERLAIRLHAGENINDQHTFARHLLTFLQLDVDLFGKEVVVFPALEFTTTMPSRNDVRVAEQEPEKLEEEAVAPEEPEAHETPHVSVFLAGITSWEEEDISEGDEDAESDAYDDEGMGEAAELGGGIQPYDTDEDGNNEEEAEEERNVVDANYSSHASQDEADLEEGVKDPEPNVPKDEEIPETEENTSTDQPNNKAIIPEPNTRREWRQGRKIDGRFCFVQGSPDDTATLIVSIAALGQLEILS